MRRALRTGAREGPARAHREHWGVAASRVGGRPAAGVVAAVPGVLMLERLAEADGNRTRQTEVLGLTGFEDRGAHQDTYASVCSPYTWLK